MGYWKGTTPIERRLIVGLCLLTPFTAASSVNDDFRQCRAELNIKNQGDIQLWFDRSAQGCVGNKYAKAIGAILRIS